MTPLFLTEYRATSGEGGNVRAQVLRGNKMAELSLGTNGNPGNVKEQMSEITLGM
jgi:hypothetical protein